MGQIQPHYAFVSSISCGPNDGAWIAACTFCGRLATPPRDTRHGAERDATTHGQLVSYDQAVAIMRSQLHAS